MDTITKRFKQQYVSSEDVSRVIADDLRAYYHDMSLPDDVVAQVELCLVEVVNNAYEHAYQYKDKCPIEISSYLNEDHEVVIEISDYGQSMTEEQFSQAVSADFIEPDPDDPATWTTSGRGFIIVVELTDNLEYINQGEKNTFKLFKRIKN